MPARSCADLPHPASRISHGHLRGVTLMELLLASSIGFVVLLAIGQVDVTRVRLSSDIGGRIIRSGEASLAVASIVRDLERADRVVLMNDNCAAAVNANGSCVKIRIPEAACGVGLCTCSGGIPITACFDESSSYRWVQYRFDATAQEIRRHDDMRSCAAKERFVGVIGLTLSFMDEMKLPPLGGIEPLGGLDNNLMQVDVQWRRNADPSDLTPQTNRSEVMLRGVPYASGTGPIGLDVTGVSPPPGACP